jgi:ABC-type multidrug transport system fused ATPase/permease subunit
LEVDGQEINRSNVRNWQRSIGYVPQHIYLADSTVTNNIAFGVDTNKIDHRKVKIASKVACLDDFIEELPFKYETFIGERGVRLSGGQRQRIGIARAIYNDPKLLILDEATSALDIATERKVMNQIHSVTENITIIIIAHRLTTLFKSDKIYLFEKGKIKSQGSYKELEKFNDYFKSIK